MSILFGIVGIVGSRYQFGTTKVKSKNNKLFFYYSIEIFHKWNKKLKMEGDEIKLSRAFLKWERMICFLPYRALKKER